MMDMNSEISQITENQPLFYSCFCEKMTAFMIRQYNNVPSFFKVAKEVFLLNWQHFSPQEQSKAIIHIFRDAYRTFNYHEKCKLHLRFIDFTKNLPLTDKVFDNLFYSFLLLVKNRVESGMFIIKAAACECYADAVNNLVVDKFFSDDFSLLRNLSADEAQALVRYLYDSTLLYIARNISTSYYDYDDLLIGVIKERKMKVLDVFLSNPYIIFDDYVIDVLDATFKDVTDISLRKTVLRAKTHGYDVSFSTFVDYYRLLSKEERERESEELNRIAHDNRFVKGYEILVGGFKGKNGLKGLSLDNFISLSDIIKENYSGMYQETLISLLKTSLKKESYDNDDVILCMEKYPEIILDMLKIPEIEEISLFGEEYRYRVLTILKKQNLLDKLSLLKYRG